MRPTPLAAAPLPAALFLVAACTGATGRGADVPAPGAESRRVSLQGHRGARGLAPENTLEGVRTALSVGVDVLELDCGLTRDGVLVVHHDPHLSPDIARDAGGAWLEPPTPALRDLDAAALQRYDVGTLRPGTDYAARFPAQRGRDSARIPALAEVFDLAEPLTGSSIRYNLETKISPAAPEATAPPERFAEALAAILTERGLSDRASVQSFDWRSLAHLRRIAPDISRVCLTSEDPGGDTIQRGQEGPSPWTAGLDVDDYGGSVPELVRAAGCQAWSPRLADVDSRSVREAQALGLEVVVWTVNERADIDGALALGVDGIISDRPDRVRAAFARHGLPLPPRFPR